MNGSRAQQLVDLMRGARIVDLPVTTGENLPCSPPGGQRMAQFMMNWYAWPAGPFLEYIQVHDDHTGSTSTRRPASPPRLDTGLLHATEFGSVTIEQLPLDQLMGPAVVVDVRSLLAGQPPGEKTRLRESPVIGKAFLVAWEAANGAFQAGEIVLFRTGWSDEYYVPYPEGFGYDRSHPAPGARRD